MKRILKIALASALMLIFILEPASALSQMGSRGDEVRLIQEKLSALGYYSGNIDGIFGSGTKNAVTRFQQDNGLKVDGIAGKQTLSALGIGTSSGGASADCEYALLARLISAEARGESYIGQVAVGAVVLNRVEHPSFPDNINDVIYQRGAFTCITDGQFNEPVADSAYSAARDALNGLDPSDGAIYYFNPSTATSSWIWSRPAIKTIGKHRFCK